MVTLIQYMCFYSDISKAAKRLCKRVFKLKCINIVSAAYRIQPSITVLLTVVPFPSLNEGSLSRHVAATFPGGPALILTSTDKLYLSKSLCNVCRPFLSCTAQICSLTHRRQH